MVLSLPRDDFSSYAAVPVLGRYLVLSLCNIPWTISHLFCDECLCGQSLNHSLPLPAWSYVLPYCTSPCTSFHSIALCPSGPSFVLSSVTTLSTIDLALCLDLSCCSISFFWLPFVLSCCTSGENLSSYHTVPLWVSCPSVVVNLCAQSLALYLSTDNILPNPVACVLVKDHPNAVCLYGWCRPEVLSCFRCTMYSSPNYFWRRLIPPVIWNSYLVPIFTKKNSLILCGRNS